MRLIRSVLLKHSFLALAVGLAGLILRLAVPAGFMPALHHGQLTLTICSGDGAAEVQSARPSASPMPAMEHRGEGRSTAEGSCAFADLALLLIAGVDSVQPAAMVLFILVTALSFGALLPPRAALRLRPPLRGPPLLT